MKIAKAKNIDLMKKEVEKHIDLISEPKIKESIKLNIVEKEKIKEKKKEKEKMKNLFMEEEKEETKLE